MTADQPTLTDLRPMLTEDEVPTGAEAWEWAYAAGRRKAIAEVLLARVESLAAENAALRGRLARVEAILAAWDAWDGSPGPDGRIHPDASSPRDRDHLRAALAADADTDGGED